ncbi:uncharacterized protein LOC120548283 [Perca fluviatilis]|uniref:uncharacterized protein LOC120548283 n=1 Tax=Perca fluviatilis TaxID=8168 RepID=UPI00196385D9|nr:uncharacterized protein LOC120548283 [Perca fluviatilis]
MLLDQQEMEQESGTNLKNLFRGSGRSPGIRNLKFPPSIEDLQDYQRYHEGSCPTAKQLENTQSNVFEGQVFIFYLAKGQTELFSWLFLRSIDGIQKYTAHLQSVGKTITTALSGNPACHGCDERAAPHHKVHHRHNQDSSPVPAGSEEPQEGQDNILRGPEAVSGGGHTEDPRAAGRPEGKPHTVAMVPSPRYHFYCYFSPSQPPLWSLPGGTQ